MPGPRMRPCAFRVFSHQANDKNFTVTAGTAQQFGDNVDWKPAEVRRRLEDLRANLETWQPLLKGLPA